MDKQLSKSEQLAQAFDQFFEIVIADTTELREEVYKLRYNVYCLDMHFENAQDYPTQMESDQFDAHSIHVLLRHRTSNTYAGTVRLVNNYTTQPIPQLPIELHCKDKINSDVFDFNKMDRTRFGEISRLAVAPQFRKRTGESHTPHGVCDAAINQFTEYEKRIFPHIALGLYLACGSIVLQQQLDTAVVMMEPRLARHMRLFGIHCIQAGEVVEYHGLRSAFVIDIKDNWRRVRPEIQGLLDLITGQIQKYHNF